MGRDLLKVYVTGNQPNWATVAANSHDVRAVQWRTLKSRYLGNKHDKGEKDLVAKVDRYLHEAPALETRLSQVSDLLNTVELAQNKTASPVLFFAAAQNLRECETVRVDATKIAQLDQLVALEKHAGNIKELRQTRAKRISLSKTLGIGNNDQQDQSSVQSPKQSKRGIQRGENNDKQYV